MRNRLVWLAIFGAMIMPTFGASLQETYGCNISSSQYETDGTHGHELHLRLIVDCVRPPHDDISPMVSERLRAERFSYDEWVMEENRSTTHFEADFWKFEVSPKG